MADLGTNVRYIKGIGEARAAALEKLGITTLGDLIAYFPRGYEDRTQVRPIRELTAGESVCVRGMVAADLTAYRISGGRTIAKTRVVDDSGSLDLVFFNMEHRRDALHQGDVCVFFGKVEDNLRRKQMINPLFEPEGRQQVTGRIMPIYPLTAGVTQGLMARAARQGLDACRELLPDVLPDEVYERQNIRIEEIDLKDLVILSPGNCMRDQIIELCQARRSMPSHYSFESGSLDTLMRIVDCTSCLTIIPEMAVEYIPSDRRDRLKTLSKGATSRKIAVAVRRTYVKNSIIR